MSFSANASAAMTKMIIETCMLTKEEIVTATKLVAEAGIDWVKTSTGQYAGPSVSDVILMVEALEGSDTKVKVAGVKAPRPQNAFAFILAAVTKMPESNLLYTALSVRRLLDGQ